MKKNTLLCCLSVILMGRFMAANALAAPADLTSNASSKASADRTFKLPSDERHSLWIPSDYELRGNKVDVLIDFHGSPRVVRESARLAGLNCVVISVNYGGFSSVYRKPFSADRQLFAAILNEALAELRAQPDFSDEVEWGRLAVSSFSAGFGAVRELLKSPAYFDRIDGIYLVDSLYCGYVGDGTASVEEGVVHPGLMQDFLRYAQASAEGKKVMVVTHCDGPTPGYASTRETADYLLAKLKLEPTLIDSVVELPAGAKKPAGELRLYRQAVRQGFSLFGSPGPNETDHGEHLRHMARWLSVLPLAKRKVSALQPAN